MPRDALWSNDIHCWILRYDGESRETILDTGRTDGSLITLKELVAHDAFAEES
jgi:hypothetical protein